MQTVPTEPLAIGGMQRDPACRATRYTKGRPPRFERINGETRQAYADSSYGESQPKEGEEGKG